MARRKKILEARDEKERDAQSYERVQDIMHSALGDAWDAATTNFNLEQALIELEYHRRAALAHYPQQIPAANKATFGKCELVGLRRNQVVVGSPEDWNKAKSQDEVLGKIERAHGPRAVKLFQNFIDEMRRLDEDESDSHLLEQRKQGANGK